MECSSRVYTHTRIYKRRKGQRRYYIDQSQLEKRALSLSAIGCHAKLLCELFFSFLPLLPPSLQHSRHHRSAKEHTTHFSSLLPFRIRKSRRKMDINPAGGGMEKEEDGQTLKKKKKSYIYFYSPFFFFFIFFLLQLCYTQRERERPGEFSGHQRWRPPLSPSMLKKKIFTFFIFFPFGQKRKETKNK